MPRISVKFLIFTATIFSICFFTYFNSFFYNKIIYQSNSKNTLNPNLILLLEKFNEPIHITLFSRTPQLHYALKPFVHQLNRGIDYIKYDWQTITPQNIQNHQPYATNILMISHQDRELFLDLEDKPINEALFLNVFLKLIREENRWISFINGHDESNIYDSSKKGLDLLNLALSNQGFKTSILPSQNISIIPNNINFLIIASSKNPWLPKEEKMLEDFIKQGGSILYLSDPKDPPIHPLDEFLGINWYPGIVLDAGGQKLGTPHPAISLIQTFPELPFSTPKQLVVLPFAKALESNKIKDIPNWEHQPILVTSDNTWIEKNSTNSEIHGPLIVGMLFKNTQNPHQKIIVIGNSRFVQNSAIQNYGNLAMILSICNYLQPGEMLADLPQIENQAAPSSIHYFTAITIQCVYTLYLPAVLFLIIIFLHLRRAKNWL